MSRKHRVVRDCENVTYVHVGKCVIRIWSDPKGGSDPRIRLEVETENPVEVDTDRPIETKITRKKKP